jgi:CheY-like chemotaxis protein
MENYVVLMDDDPDELFFVERALADLGVRHYSFKSPLDGLALLSSGLQESPTHIFLDLNMPGLNGEDVLKKIRKIAAFNDTTVVIWSSAIDEKSKQSLAASGANLVIVKPASIPDYKEILVNIFDRLPVPVNAG